MTRHLCTGCHGGWRSARCRPPWCLEYWRGGYTMARLAHENRLGSATVALCPEGCATTVPCTVTAPAWCHVAQLAPCRRRAVWAAPRWRSTLKIAPRWHTCTLAAPRWRSATELAPRRHRAVWAVPLRRRAPKIAPRRHTCTLTTLVAPRWCPATKPAPCRRRAVGAAPRWHSTLAVASL